jgi:hypothetical protein
MTTRFTRSIRAEALVLALACALWLGCRADTTGLGTLTVEEVNARLAAGTDVVLCDANSADTRTKLGVVAGAQLLSSLTWRASCLPTKPGHSSSTATVRSAVLRPTRHVGPSLPAMRRCS